MSLVLQTRYYCATDGLLFAVGNGATREISDAVIAHLLENPDHVVLPGIVLAEDGVAPEVPEPDTAMAASAQ